MRVPVVFANEEDWEFPDSCEVHGFVNSADTGATFPKKRRRDLAGLANFGRKCGTHRVRYAHANDGIHAEHANANIGDVHRAALGAIASRRLAVEFGHHPPRVASARDGNAMPAIGRQHRVGWPQCGAHAHRRRLLPDVRMRRPAIVALAVQPDRLLFKTANLPHLPQQRKWPIRR